MAEERLQKLMAAAGIGSRRMCETLITAGRVQVNGATVTELGAKADPKRDRIMVDGRPLKLQPDHVYWKVHKPRGVISDIGGDEIDLRTGELRKTVADLLPADHARVFPVGRLDLHSEGLVLLTDDGELANRLTHPRYQHPKTYYVLLAERPGQEALARLRNGVDLPEGRTAPADVMVVEHLPSELRLSRGPNEGIWLRVVLREGKKRQIRHMTAAVGYPTLRLVRWAIGPLTMGKLELGEAEPLTADEINSLRHLAGLEGTVKARPMPRGKGATKPGGKPAGKPGARPARSANPRTSTPNRAGARPAAGAARTTARPTARPGATDGYGRGEGDDMGRGGKPAARAGDKPRYKATVRYIPAEDGAADRPAGKPTRRPGDSPAGKPGAKGPYKPRTSSATKPGAKPGAKPGPKPGAKPGTKPGARPGPTAPGKPPARRPDKPAGKPAGKPSAKSSAPRAKGADRD